MDVHVKDKNYPIVLVLHIELMSMPQVTIHSDPRKFNLSTPFAKSVSDKGHFLMNIYT